MAVWVICKEGQHGAGLIKAFAPQAGERSLKHHRLDTGTYQGADVGGLQCICFQTTMAY